MSPVEHLYQYEISSLPIAEQLQLATLILTSATRVRIFVW